MNFLSFSFIFYIDVKGDPRGGAGPNTAGVRGHWVASNAELLLAYQITAGVPDIGIASSILWLEGPSSWQLLLATQISGTPVVKKILLAYQVFGSPAIVARRGAGTSSGYCCRPE